MVEAQKTVLIVDDDQDIVEFMRAMLEDSGYLVQTASTYQEIERIVNISLPDLVLLDLLLSGTNGRTIAQQLRGRTTTAAIPIIMLSAHPHAETEAAEAAVDGFLAKPFEMSDFLAIVAHAITNNEELNGIVVGKEKDM